jgi:hypothetical protein
MIKKTKSYSIMEIARGMAGVHSKALMLEAIQDRGLLETSLISKNLSSFLLSEAEEEGPKFTEEDANTLSASIDKMKAGMEALAGALNKSDNKFPNTLKAVQALGTDIPEVGDLASMAISGDAKGLAKKVEDVNTKLSNAGKASASIIGAADSFMQNLAPVLDKIPDEDKELPLEELANKYGEDDAIKFPDIKTLKKGAAKAVAVPKWYQQAFKGGMDAAKSEAGGFFSAVGSFFKGLFGDKETGIDPNTFAEEIVKCTPVELEEVAAGITEVQSGFEEAISDTAAATTSAQAGAEMAANPEAAKGGEGGEELEKELGAPPAKKEEAEEEQAAAEEELQAAAEEAAAEITSPADAAMGAVQGWYDGLSDTSKKTMDSKDRIGGLKTGIQTSLDGAADAIAKVVAKAVQKWRSEHEETLIKSKRFAKKNFDSLEQLIPQLAASMVSKAEESRTNLTVGKVYRITYSYLNRKFREELKSGMLHEALIPMMPLNNFEKRNDDRDAWQKIAGLPYESNYETPAEALSEDRYVYDEEEIIAEKWRRIAGIPEEN